MIIFKCKMCGGDLHPIENATTCECEYCGSVQTIPTADNEKKMNLFNRAQRLLRSCEFDKAAGVYESIVAEFPEEAEAYWGLVLCKYGIEYVDDPASGRKVPTCHRSSFDSVMEDSNFEQACENADAVARRVYRDEAKAIEELRKGIIEVSGKEEPYDIFICYKETDENGDRTLDSVLAQDIYDALTEKGYRVFFSRITLEDKLGQEYEPYIFAALNSAKVMLAVGTDYEYYNAVWVKNEWSRFLKLIASGEKKTLIPCYKGIDAYDMPKEFAKLQAQDMGKVGAMQDLVRGIEKIISLKDANSMKDDHGKNPEVAAQISNYLEMAENAYKAQNFAEMEAYSNKAIELDPTDYRAWIMKGKAAGWQSSTQNNRIPETITTFEKAIANTPEESKEEVKNTIVDTISSLLIAMVFVRIERFNKWLDAEEAKGVIDDIDSIKMCGLLMASKFGCTINMQNIANQIVNKMVDPLPVAAIRGDYNTSAFPDKMTWDAYRQRISNAVMVYEKAVEFAGEECHMNVVLCNAIVSFSQWAIDSCSYDYKYLDYGHYQDIIAMNVREVKQQGFIPDPDNSRYYYKEYTLTEAGKQEYRRIINKYKEKQSRIQRAIDRALAEEKAAKEKAEKEAAQKSRDEYWAAHADLKASLESEREDLTKQIEGLNNSTHEQISNISRQISDASKENEIDRLSKEIEQYESYLKTLGIFKGKEKKETQASIDALKGKRKLIQDEENSRKRKLQSEMESVRTEAQRSVKKLQDRINIINSQLSNPRNQNDSAAIIRADSVSDNSMSSDTVHSIESIPSPLPGTITGIRVKRGDAVRKGDVMVLVTVMKMENEIMAPYDATVQKIEVGLNQTVNKGDALVSLYKSDGNNLFH